MASAVLLSGQDTRSGPELTPTERREKRIEALIEEVAIIAAAEPPQLAVDSYIRIAKTIRRTHPEKAVTLLESAKERLGALHSDAARASLTSLLGQFWSEISGDEAEELCKSIPKGLAGEFESDPKSACWATRIARENRTSARAEASLRAVADGAYSTTQHATTITQLQKADPEAAAAFFSAYLAGFPERSAGLPELKGLIHFLRAAGPDQPSLSRQAVEMGVRAIERKDFPEPKQPLWFEARIDGRTIKTSGARDSLAFQFADLAWLIAPDLFESHADSLGKWKTEVSGGDWQRRRVTRFRESSQIIDAGVRRALGIEDMEAIDLDALSPEQTKSALDVVRNPTTRLMILLQMLTGNDSPPEERARIVKGMTATISKMPANNRLRLFALYFLFDDAYRRGAFQSVTEFGKLMTAGFDATLGCPEASCEIAAVEMEAGELVSNFADYLDGKDLTASGAGVLHPSLQLREDLIELGRLIEEAHPRQQFKIKAP